MKTIFLLTLALSAFALEWRSYDAALKESAKTGKVIMIDAVRTGCHYCDDMEREVFDDANMSAWIEARFVPVKINLSETPMPLGLRVPMTPSFFFIGKGEKVLKKIPGSWNIEDFKSMLEGVKDE